MIILNNYTFYHTDISNKTKHVVRFERVSIEICVLRANERHLQESHDAASHRKQLLLLLADSIRSSMVRSPCVY